MDNVHAKGFTRSNFWNKGVSALWKDLPILYAMDILSYESQQTVFRTSFYWTSSHLAYVLVDVALTGAGGGEDCVV